MKTKVFFALATLLLVGPFVYIAYAAWSGSATAYINGFYPNYFLSDNNGSITSDNNGGNGRFRASAICTTANPEMYLEDVSNVSLGANETAYYNQQLYGNPSLPSGAHTAYAYTFSLKMIDPVTPLQLDSDTDTANYSY